VIVFESERARRLVVRVERGEDLRGALEKLATDEAIEAGVVRGIGAFEAVALAEYDQVGREYRPARPIGRCEVLALEGNLSIADGGATVRLHATVSRETDAGLQVLGGHVEAATAFSLELVVEVFEDLRLTREADPATGLALWVGETREVPAAPVAAGVSWGDVAAASAEPPRRPVEEIDLEPGRKKLRRKKVERIDTSTGGLPTRRARAKVPDFLDEPEIEAGDWVDHKHFGLCRVDRVNPDGGLLIKLESGRRKLIKLEPLEVLEPREDAKGRLVYPLRPKKKK